jgi:hypothetical protein
MEVTASKRSERAGLAQAVELPDRRQRSRADPGGRLRQRYDRNVGRVLLLPPVSLKSGFVCITPGIAGAPAFTTESKVTPAGRPRPSSNAVQRDAVRNTVGAIRVPEQTSTFAEPGNATSAHLL